MYFYPLQRIEFCLTHPDRPFWVPGEEALHIGPSLGLQRGYPGSCAMGPMAQMMGQQKVKPTLLVLLRGGRGRMEVRERSCGLGTPSPRCLLWCLFSPPRGLLTSDQDSLLCLACP